MNIDGGAMMNFDIETILEALDRCTEPGHREAIMNSLKFHTEWQHSKELADKNAHIEALKEQMIHMIDMMDRLISEVETETLYAEAEGFINKCSEMCIDGPTEPGETVEVELKEVEISGTFTVYDRR